MAYKARRHERTTLVADVTIRSRDMLSPPVRATMFNASKSGIAVFSDTFLPSGTPVVLEVSLPIEGVGLRQIEMAGIVCRATVRADGNELGIELMPACGTGQREWVGRYLKQQTKDGGGKAGWVRRPKRMALVLDVTLRSKGGRGEALKGTTLNVSRNGAAVLMEKKLPVGSHLMMDFAIPADDGLQEITLEAVVQRSNRHSVGDIVAVKFVPESHPDEYEWFGRYLEARFSAADTTLRSCASLRSTSRHETARKGFTLMELSVTLIIICVLVTMAMPSYNRAMEQARGDAAGGNLRSIWSAQRIYWMEHKTFASSLSQLESMDLVDPALRETQTSENSAYVYQMISGDSNGFIAAAARNGSDVWIGTLSMNQDGQLMGVIIGPGGQSISPLQ